ncbi:hypothetical protein EI94DRAFT_1698246 [Lactarius quietus]|nr:hypothetical protein EI94DRAFT_1698246 [Lactarius quietus]
MWMVIEISVKPTSGQWRTFRNIIRIVSSPFTAEGHHCVGIFWGGVREFPETSAAPDMATNLCSAFKVTLQGVPHLGSAFRILYTDENGIREAVNDLLLDRIVIHLPFGHIVLVLQGMIGVGGQGRSSEPFRISPSSFLTCINSPYSWAIECLYTQQHSGRTGGDKAGEEEELCVGLWYVWALGEISGSFSSIELSHPAHRQQEHALEGQHTIHYMLT